MIRPLGGLGGGGARGERNAEGKFSPCRLHKPADYAWRGAINSRVRSPWKPPRGCMRGIAPRICVDVRGL